MAANADPSASRPRSERAILVIALLGAAGAWALGIVALLLLQSIWGFLWDLWGLLGLLVLLLGAGAFLAALFVHYLRRRPASPTGTAATMESLQTRQL